LDEGVHVGVGDEIDRVVAAAEHQDLPGGLQRPAHDRGPSLHEGGGPHDGPGDAAGTQRFLGGVLGPEQPDRVARRVSCGVCWGLNSPIWLLGAAATTETRTNVAPARAAAPMRLALPARS